ncbi:ArdC-like ssDNA-binding domain-containing protein [Nitrospira sp. BLG_2]|uniref:ArdC-like ssDNA-binding domain-containing protein n=1 Tax=Nitrospira sp. BLG_2 TaxID=3397507 RepID=UPI003B9AE442
MCIDQCVDPIGSHRTQALELNAHVRKSEKGPLMVNANSIIRKETDEASGNEIDRDIHFMKGYTVFNVEPSAKTFYRQHRKSSRTPPNQGSIHQ